MAVIKTTRTTAASTATTIKRLRAELQRTNEELMRQQSMVAGSQALVKQTLRESDAYGAQVTEYRVLLASVLVHLGLTEIELPDKVMVELVAGNLVGLSINQDPKKRIIHIALVKGEVADDASADSD